jgi:hypothetical protein
MEASGRKLYEITDGNVGRIFETAWMSAPTARFGLVGVVLRLDRRDFAEPSRQAGDLRRGAARLSARLPLPAGRPHLCLAHALLGQCRP